MSNKAYNSFCGLTPEEPCLAICAPLFKFFKYVPFCHRGFALAISCLKHSSSPPASVQLTAA